MKQKKGRDFAWLNGFIEKASNGENTNCALTDSETWHNAAYATVVRNFIGAVDLKLAGASHDGRLVQTLYGRTDMTLF